MNDSIHAIATKTTEYLLTLPSGANTTMYQAAKVACPEEIEQLEFLDLFELCSSVIENVKKTDTILDYSEHDGKVEGLPFNLDFYVYHKRLQKAQIISNLLFYGPCPASGEPVEQHLTISATGRIWFSEKVYDPLCTSYPIGRKMQVYIGKERAAAILSKLADYADSCPQLMHYTDIGTWHLALTGTDGSKTEMSSL